MFQVRDYSGLFTIKLIPCITAVDQEYTLPIVCTPREPITFELPVRFQQVSDSVPAEFSLNTDFHLMRKRELWLSDGSMGFGDEGDAAFTEGQLNSAELTTLAVHPWHWLELLSGRSLLL